MSKIRKKLKQKSHHASKFRVVSVSLNSLSATAKRGRNDIKRRKYKDFPLKTLLQEKRKTVCPRQTRSKRGRNDKKHERDKVFSFKQNFRFLQKKGVFNGPMNNPLYPRVSCRLGVVSFPFGARLPSGGGFCTYRKTLSLRVLRRFDRVWSKNSNKRSLDKTTIKRHQNSTSAACLWLSRVRVLSEFGPSLGFFETATQTTSKRRPNERQTRDKRATRKQPRTFDVFCVSSAFWCRFDRVWMSLYPRDFCILKRLTNSVKTHASSKFRASLGRVWTELQFWWSK